MRTQKRIATGLSLAIAALSLVTADVEAQAQQSGPAATVPTVAVLNLDSKGLGLDAATLGNMVRLELEKTDTYEVMDKYDQDDIVKKSGIDANQCYGKQCLVSVGRALGVETMLSGRVERFGEKIIITLKLIDVKLQSAVKSNTTEYLNLQPEVQKMLEISVKRLLGITPDKEIVDVLVYYNTPIASPKTQIRLNGPRFGFAYATGDTGRRLQDTRKNGGFEMYPAMFQFGWQQELQYLSAGEFQALVEFLPMVSGLESGQVIPSLTVLNGFRMGKGGWEFGFGPSLRVVKKADGFYDSENRWHLKSELAPGDLFPIKSRMDSRGKEEISAGLVFVLGRTFKSGYLNIPVNAYVAPKQDGWFVGTSMGFNIFKKR